MKIFFIVLFHLSLEYFSDNISNNLKFHKNLGPPFQFGSVQLIELVRGDSDVSDNVMLVTGISDPNIFSVSVTNIEVTDWATSILVTNV